MKGDFTRDTFDPRHHFTRVLMQQGRVQLDADWNEQASILWHYLHSLATDLIGPHGGPQGDLGFGLITKPTQIDDLSLGNEEKDRMRALLQDKGFLIGKGHYYVDGRLCENEDYIPYSDQPNYPLAGNAKLDKGTYLVYLDVWERHLTYLEVEDASGSKISIRESALGLGGPDTATRAQLVWQVKTKKSRISESEAKDHQKFLKELGGEIQSETGRLNARTRPELDKDTDPCITPPDARYRGAENQLYRVEIHNGGTKEQATFKRSRDNGSVVFPIRQVAGNSVTVEHLGRDSRLGLRVGDWVEIVDDDYVLQNRAERLLQVDVIVPDDNQVTLKDPPTSDVGQDLEKHPLLRRWDQKETENTKLKEGTVPVAEGQWLDLEDGIQIQFQPGATYRTGDYWLIPARTATGDVEWPGPVGAPEALPPRGIEHHYAPLWIISVANGTVTANAGNDCRRKFG